MMRLFCWILLSSLCLTEAQRVAIIGGGISGSFSAKYLVDYDEACALQQVTVFDPQTASSDWQGSRVAATTLNDGSVVEIGASVFYSGFQLLMEMIGDDSSLEIGEAFNTGKSLRRDSGLRTGMGVYGGNGIFHFLTSNSFKLLWRYNVDIFKLFRATARAEGSFQRLYQLLASDNTGFWESPDEMWKSVGLFEAVHVTFNELMDALGVSNAVEGWRRHLPYQGVLRNELLAAIVLCNYNQGNSKVNGLVGLGSLVSAKVSLLSLVGGNHQVISSAMKQAKAKHVQQCADKTTRTNVVQHVRKQVTTVVADLNTMELYSDEENLGVFEVVILAAPLQQCRVNFYVKSQMDDAVLQPMPFALLENADDDEIPGDHEGHEAFAQPLPDHAKRPYTQVVTTLVSKAKLNAQHFGLEPQDLPRGIYMTESSQPLENNITAIVQITPNGVYKVFSSAPLAQDTLEHLFGKGHKVETVKVWGGPHGGATPDYRGQGKTMNYLLYDGGAGLKGHAEGSALYYPNAIESSFACMELSAIGAKSVAKLVAKRLRLMDLPDDQELAEEL